MEGQLKVCLVGGPPWGFRLGGGREFNIPLAVAKLRKQSVAWRAGLCENDEVLAINGVPCGTLTHTQAMQLVDYGGDYLEFLIKRTTDVEGLLHEQAVPHLSSTQKTNDYSINTGGKVMITQARQYPSQDPSSTWPGKVETSHCTDGVGVTSVSVQLTKPANDGTPPKVEYGPEGVSLQLNVPCNEISADVPESTPMAAEPPIRPFLSGGIPAEMNMDEEELIATYRERAKQAKLHRSESLAEKQQREMRRRCETIASSLASPGSSAAEYGAESKGAALFRKRRRRVKHYTLISYGTASDGVPGEEGVEYEEGDEDDDREEEGEEVNWGSQEDLFTGCNEWDHLEKGSVEQETNSAIDPGLGKGAKMFERRRQRLEELGKETSQHWVSEGKNVEDKSVMAVQNHPQLNGGTTYTSPMNAMPFGRASDPPKQSVTSIKVQSTTHSSNAFKSKELLNGHSSMTASPTMHQSHAINGFPPSEADSQSRSTAVLNRSPRPFMPGGFGSVSRPSTKAVEPYVLTMLTPDATVASAIPKTNFNRYPAAYPGRSKDINIASESIINKTDLETPARGPAQRPAILLPVGQSLMNRESETQHAPQPTTPNTENLPPREQRISIPAVHAGTLQEATKRPKQNVYNFSEGVKASQNSEQQKAMQKRGFESCPEEDFLSLGAEACNFLRAEKMRSPPPIAPKPARPGSASDVSPPITLEGRGGALFARCRNRSDHFVVDSPQNASGATVLASHSTSAAQASEETWQPTANVRSLNLSGKTKSATCSEVLVSASPQQSSPRPVPFQATMATSIQFAREQPNSGAPPAPSADTTKEASWRPVSASGSTSSKGQATFYVRKLGLQSQVPFSFPKRSGNNLCETDDDTRSEPAAWVSPALSPVPSSPNLPCRSLHTRLARSVTEAARRKTLSGPSAAWRQSGVQRSSSFSTDNSCASCPNNSLSWQWHGTGPRRVQTGGLTSKASKQQVYNVRPQGWRGLAR